MEGTSSLEPVLDQNNLVLLIGLMLALVCIGLLTLGYISIKGPDVLKNFKDSRTLHYTVLITAMVIAMLLRLEKLLDQGVVAAVLSGVIGYVAGSLRTPGFPRGNGS